MTTKIKIQIDVPYAKWFSDYHEIDHHTDGINKLCPDNSLKGYECGFNMGGYIGLFYVGKRLSPAEIKKIVQRDWERAIIAFGWDEEEMMESVTWTWLKNH